MTKIKGFRNQRGLSQEELAEKSGLSLRTIQRIENGETDPRGDSLRRLATALEIAPDNLFGQAIVEESSYLKLVCLSALSCLVFPILGVVVPLVLWLVKKDRGEELRRVAQTIIGFEIAWFTIRVAGLYIFSAVAFIHIGLIKIMILYYAFTVVVNVVFITANYLRLQSGRRVSIWPF